MAEAVRSANEVIGSAVRRAIGRAGSNLRASAQQAGLNYRTVLRYVSGERDMPVPVLIALVRASGADLAALMTDLDTELARQPPGSGPGDGERSAPPGGGGVPVDATGGRGNAPESGVAQAMRELAQSHLDRQMRDLGISRLAARSVETIGAEELLAIADVVHEIVLELRTPPDS